MARITIRPLRLTDDMDMYELMHMPNVLWGTAQLPSTPPDRWHSLIEKWLADEHRHIFVAEIQNKVVGMVGIQTDEGRRKHIGYLAMAVHDKYQGQGIGKMLMLTAIDLSDNWLNLLRLQLDVYTDNERALRLYKNFDFEIEGRIRCSSFRGGKYIDSYLMARIHQPQGNSYAESVAQIAQGTQVGQSGQGQGGQERQSNQNTQNTQPSSAAPANAPTPSAPPSSPAGEQSTASTPNISKTQTTQGTAASSTSSNGRNGSASSKSKDV